MKREVEYDNLDQLSDHMIKDRALSIETAVKEQQSHSRAEIELPLLSHQQQ